jgi:quinolinate synthase
VTPLTLAAGERLLHQLEKQNPGKRFYPVTSYVVCPNMKLTNLEKVLWSLEDMEDEVKVPEDIRRRALAAVNRMLEIV